MMSGLLQQQPSRDNRVANQRVPKPHSNQAMSYVDPMTSTNAYFPNGNVEINNKRVSYNQHNVTNNLPPYSLFPDIAMDAPKDKVHHSTSRVTADKPYVNGTNGYDTAHYPEHFHRYCDQQFQQVMRPTEPPQQQLVTPAGHYGYCVQNTQCTTKNNNNSRTMNANHLMNYRVPTSMDTTSDDNQNVTTMWPMAKVVAPASSPVLKRKEGSSQKESPRTARDFPGLPVADKNRCNSTRYDEKDTDVIVIEEDNSNNSVFSVAWKQVMAELDDRQKYAEQPEECWRTFKRPAETEPTAPPCLEAVRPNENRMQTDLYSGVPSPLEPPQLIAAVSSISELQPVQSHLPAKVQVEEPQLIFHSSDNVFNNNNILSNDNNCTNKSNEGSNFDTSIPLPPTFSDLEDLAAMFRLRSPFPPNYSDDNADLHHKELDYQKIAEEDLNATKTIPTTSSSSCGVLTPASSDVQCDTTDKFDTLSDCSRDSSKPGRKRSMLECLADSEGYVAEKKRSKTTDLFADPSQLGREERALQRAMLRFEKLEKQQQGQHSPSRPKFGRSTKSKEVMALEADETAFPRDMGSRRTYKSAFVDFKPEVLSSRTRNQSAAQKYAINSRKYNKNAAYEEELRREAKRLATFRARRKIRKRILARLFKERTESQNEHQSEEEEEESAKIHRSTQHTQDRPVLSQLNVQWRPYRCRRRHFRSGLDMISRQHRKKKPRPLGDQRNRLEIFRNRRKQLILLGDGNAKGSESGGAPPDLKRLMVNKALGETVLHRAARMGYFEVVVYCLETNYCNVNSRDNAGYTPLHECCSRGHVNISKALLQYGADVSASAAGGIRPIHDAVENDHIEIVRLLLSYGADPSIATYSGMTPAKLTRSVAMTEFFRGYTADAGVDVDNHRPVLPWLFFGSTCCFDPKDSGYNVLEGVPSDNEGDAEEDDFIFEVSDTPHLPTYRVHLPGMGGKMPYNCLLLSDILKQTGLSTEEFKATHGHIEVITISRSEFEASSTSSQLLTGTSKAGRDSDPTVSVVKLDNSIRAILGIETITLR